MWKGVQLGASPRGYAFIGDAALRADPLLRMFMRDSDIETGAGRKTATGRVVKATGRGQQDMLGKTVQGAEQGCYESLRSMLEVLMPLHYYHYFTRCVATDGSRNDQRREVGSVSACSTSYGWWEGVMPESHLRLPAWSTKSALEREELCIAKGLGGGALPPDWGSGDAELYAIYRYLRRVVDESDAPGGERVLILSDCKSMLQAIERAWRAGDASGCKGGRAAMLEAICRLRAQLDRGITPNEYADMAAAAHASCAVEDVSQVIGMVESRDCLYETTSEYSESMSLTDRRSYRLVRYHMARWVRRRLAREATSMRTDAAFVDGKRHNYGAGGIATDVVVGTARSSKWGWDERQEKLVGVHDTKAEHERVGFHCTWGEG